MRWLLALSVLALLGLPATAESQICGAGAPYWYTPTGWYATGAYGPTGCYWVPASNNAALQPQLYPSQQQPTTTSLAGAGNAGVAGWYLYPPGLGPSQAGPFAPSGYAAGGASVAPGTVYPAVAGAPISPWQYPAYAWTTAYDPILRQGAFVPSGSDAVAGPATAAGYVPLGSLTGPLLNGGGPPATTGTATVTGTPSSAPPVPGRGGGNYIGDDPSQRDTITIVRP
jgi:hypothetical protein